LIYSFQLDEYGTCLLHWAHFAKPSLRANALHLLTQ